MTWISTIGSVFGRVGRYLIHLVRDDAYTDIRATYPEQARASQEQAATHGFVTVSLSGFGGTH